MNTHPCEPNTSKARLGLSQRKLYSTNILLTHGNAYRNIWGTHLLCFSFKAGLDYEGHLKKLWSHFVSGVKKRKLGKNYNFFPFPGKVELHGKRIEVEHSVPKKQRYLLSLE